MKKFGILKKLFLLFFATVINVPLLSGADVCMTTFDKDFTAPSDSYLSAITALDDSFDAGSNYAVSYYFNIPMDGTVDFTEITFPSKTDFYYELNACATAGSTSLSSGTTINVATGDELYIYTITDKNKEFSFTLDYAAIDYYALDDAGETNGTEPVVIDILDNDHSESSTIDPTTVTIVTPVTKGNLVIDPATGVATYTPDTTFDDNADGDFFTYTVDTANGDTTNIATVTITFPKPIAYDKFYSVAPGETISGNLITDAPMNHNILNDLIMNSNTSPAEGTLSTISSDGNFTYDAPGSETGTTFTYSIKNKYQMVSDTATVTIFINNYCGDAITLLNPDSNCTTDDTNSTGVQSVTEYAQYYNINIPFGGGRLDINLSNNDASTAKTTLYYDFGSECGTIFAKGTTSQIDAGYPSEFASMILTEGTYTLGLYGVSKANPVEYKVDVNFTSACGGGAIYPTGSSAVGVNEPGVDYDSDKNIKTKIVNKTFGLRATHLDSSGSVAAYDDQGTGEKMVVTLQHADKDCKNPEELITFSFSDGNIYFDLPDDLPADQQVDLKIDSASKEKRIRVSALDYSQLLSDSSGLNCGKSSLTSALCMVPACFNSVDNILSVFPPAFQPNVMVCVYGDGGGNAPCDSDAYYGNCGGTKGNVSPEKYNVKNGCAMCLSDAVNAPCSDDNFAVRPDYFDSSITTGQTFKAGVAESLTFNAFDGEEVNPVAPSANYNELEDSSFVVDVNISDSTRLCQDMSIKFDEDVDFTDGTVTDNYTLNNVGDFNVTMHEITGSEFALVDADDTNDTDRLITPYFQQIKVIPDHFGIFGSLQNGSNGFTYLSNFEIFDTNESRNISASLDLNITAQAENNTTTSNYTSLCYAKDGNLKLTLSNPIVVTPAGALNNLLWYHYTPDSNGSVVLDGVTVEYSFPYLQDRFDSNDTNGTAEFNYRINFDRNRTTEANPFIVVIDEINATDTDNASGVNSVDSNATFVFGRTHASRQRYDTPTGTANIYFEYYCFGAGCDTTLLNGFSPSLNKTDDIRWFINEAHVTPANGNVGTVQQKDLTPLDASDDIVDVTAQDNSVNPSTADLDYDESKGYPYKTTMHNNASPWLIYNETDPTATRNEFQVEFDSTGDWTGEHETNTTTADPAAVKSNRRIIWH